MLIETGQLPTHVAAVARRLNTVGPDASADTFLAISYVAKAAIKTIAVALHANLREQSRSHAYRIAHDLLRADGLGARRAIEGRAVAEHVIADAGCHLRGCCVAASKR